MTYAIENGKVDQFDTINIRNTETEESFSIIPALGGTVYQISLKDNRGKVQPILAADAPEMLEANELFRGRILFPFNDRIPEAKYEYAGNSYQLPVNNDEDGSSIHGFLYNKAMNVIAKETDSESASVTLEYRFQKDEVQGYPFAVGIQINYQLNKQGFTIAWQVTNHGDIKAPFALGWHPYFTAGKKVDDSTLTMNSEKFVEVDKDLTPTRNIPSVEGTQFNFKNGTKLEGVELDIAVTAPNGPITLQGEEYGITFKQSTNFPYVQLYTPENRESIAIEPITGATNSFNFHELGLLELNPNEQFQSKFEISVN